MTTVERRDAGLPQRAQGYVHALVQLCAGREPPAVSAVLFGSAAKGGFAAGISDVDSIIVVDDSTSPDCRRAFADEIERLEIAHDLRPAACAGKTALETFAERAGGNALSSFVCTRSDLLSGDAARLFELRPAEALFVDRILYANVILSAITIWGEDLLPRVPIPPLRRLDVAKAFFLFANQVLLSLAGFAVLPDATRYAMGSLKRSLHSCFFCYTLRAAPLEEEVALFRHVDGVNAVLDELLALRARYRPSFGFVFRCLPALARLHWRAAWDNGFPRRVVRPG